MTHSPQPVTRMTPDATDGPAASEPPAHAGERAALIRNKALIARRAWASSRPAPNWLERLLGLGTRSGRHVGGEEISDRIRQIQAQNPEFTFGQATARSAFAEAQSRPERRRRA